MASGRGRVIAGMAIAKEGERPGGFARAIGSTVVGGRSSHRCVFLKSPMLCAVKAW